MKTTDVFAALRASNSMARSQGLSAIEIDVLDAYVDSLEETGKLTPEGVMAEMAALEHYKANLNAINAKFEREHAAGLEMLRTVITSAQGAIKTGLLINGGAAVAMLGFIGQVLKQQGQQSREETTLALVFFGSGVLFSGLASAGAYFSQLLYSYTAPRAKTIGVGAHVLTALVGLAAFMVFPVGVHYAAEAMQLLGT